MKVDDNTSPVGVAVDALAALTFGELKALVFEGFDDLTSGGVA